MLADKELQDTLRGFICVQWEYDGMGGSVLQWTNKHGNTHADPSVLGWILEPNGEKEIKRLLSEAHNVQALHKALKESAAASFPLIDVAEFKILKKEAASVASRANLGVTLKTLREKAASSNAGEQAEAKKMLDKLLPAAEWKRGRAEAAKSDDPLAAVTLLTELANEYRGDEIGEKAKTEVETLKKDPKFQSELKAAQAMAAVDAFERSYKPSNPRAPQSIATDEKWRKTNIAALQNIAGVLAGIIKNHPGTAAAKRAETLATEWQLK